MSSPDSDTAFAGSKIRILEVKSQITPEQRQQKQFLRKRVRSGFMGRRSIDSGTFIQPRLESPQPVVRTEQPALIMTNERFSASMLKEWGKLHHPDGYIVAVGCGASLFLPHLFSETSPPKGVALIDLDDRVVAMSQAFVAALQQCLTYDEFYERFFKDPVQAAPGFLPSQQALVFESMPPDDQLSLKSGISSVQLESGSALNNRGQPNFLPSMRELFPVWKSLADAGKIQVLHASVTDSHVHTQLLTKWPDYGDCINVVYLSNVLDHLVDGAYPQNISPNSSLHGSFWITNLDKMLPSQLTALNQWDSGSMQTLFFHTLRVFNYNWHCEAGSIKDIHPLDFATSGLLLDLIRLLPKSEVIENLDESMNLAQSDLPFDDLADLYEEMTSLSHNIVLALAFFFSEYISMYNRNREFEAKDQDGLLWLLRRFGPALAQLVQAYDNSSHSRVVHA